MVGRAHPQEPGCLRRERVEDRSLHQPDRASDPDEAARAGQAQPRSGLPDQAGDEKVAAAEPPRGLERKARQDPAGDCCAGPAQGEDVQPDEGARH